MAHDSSFEFVIVAGRRVLTEVHSFWDALQSLMGAYFAFNVEYLKTLRALFLFVQQYVFGLKDAQNVPLLREGEPGYRSNVQLSSYGKAIGIVSKLSLSSVLLLLLFVFLPRLPVCLDVLVEVVTSHEPLRALHTHKMFLACTVCSPVSRESI